MIYRTENMLKEEIIMAKDWLLNSGIQETEGEQTGGFNSWFDMDSARHSYVYSEITGYGITTLLFLNDLFEEDLMDKARIAAGWIKNKALHESGGIRTRYYHHEMSESEKYSFKSNNMYAFDCGMVLYGLVNFYRVSGDIEYLELSKSLANFMLENMRNQNGLFFAVYNPSTGEKTDVDDKWSTQSGSYHAKLVLGFTDLYEVTEEEVYKEVTLSLCGKAIELQDASGRFVTSRADNSTHMHPHAYSAEGLLYAGIHFNRNDFIDSAEKAVKWSLDNQDLDGGIPKKYDGKAFVNLYRTDILAQILRLGVVLISLGRLDEASLSKLEKLRNSLLLFQYKENDRQKGGFYYGFTLDGEKKEHINSWCSMFALQALIMFDQSGLEENNIKKMEYFI